MNTLSDFRDTTKTCGVAVGGTGGGAFAWPTGMTDAKKKKYAPQK